MIRAAQRWNKPLFETLKGRTIQVEVKLNLNWDFFFSLTSSDLNFFSKFSHVKDIQAEVEKLRDSSVGWKLDAGLAFLSFPIRRPSVCFSRPMGIPALTSPILTSISKSFSSTVFISTIRSRLGVLSRGVPWVPWEPSKRSKLRRRSSTAGSMLLSFCRGLSRQRGYSLPTSSLITLSCSRIPLIMP